MNTTTIATPDKVRTIVETYLATGIAGAMLGELVEFEPGRYRVTADGKTVIVQTCTRGWRVTFKAFAGIDPALAEAARLALEGGSRRDVSTVSDALR